MTIVAVTIARIGSFGQLESSRSARTNYRRNTTMKGVQFLIEDEGERKAVIIDLSIHREFWEDFFDAVVSKDRQDEPQEPLNEVRRKVLGN